MAATGLPSVLTYRLEHLRVLIATIAAHTGKSKARLGREMAGSPQLLEHLMKGGGCTASKAEDLSDYFDAEWPADLAWPRGVPRNPPQPPRSRREEEGAHAAHRTAVP